MYTRQEFKDYLFIDIETAGQHASYADLDDRSKEIWATKAQNQRDYEPGMQDLTDEELYNKTSSWFAESGKIICISIGQVKFDDLGNPEAAKIKSFYGEDESTILQEFNGTVAAIFSKNPAVKFIGHNIKKFDMPWIVKRSLVNSLPVPYQFHFQKQKPWENCLLDTYEIWKFGGMKSAGLDTICHVLNVPSPKVEMQNYETSEYFWKGEVEKIKSYCEDDVKATMNIMLRMAGMDILN